MLFYSNGTYVGRNILASGYPAFHGFDLKVCITFFTDSFLTREKITFYKKIKKGLILTREKYTLFYFN